MKVNSVIQHNLHFAPFQAYFLFSLTCLCWIFRKFGWDILKCSAFFSITPQPLNMGCVWNRILPYRRKTVCDKKMPEFKIVIKEAKSTQMGHLTIPWVHGKGFMNDSDTMQQTLVGHMTITTYFGPFSQQRKSENCKCIYLQKVNLFSYTKSLE